MTETGTAAGAAGLLVVKAARVLVFRVLCEIGGKIDIYGGEISRFGGLVEWWAAQHRDRP